MRRHIIGRPLGPIVALAVACAMTVFVAPARGDLKPAAGWGTSSDYEKALKVAKEKHRPVAVMWAFRDSTCPLHNDAAAAVMHNKQLSGALRVLVYYDEKNDDVRKLQQQTETGGKLRFPMVFMLDPQGQLVSFV